jgi:hypothetical protein
MAWILSPLAFHMKPAVRSNNIRIHFAESQTPSELLSKKQHKITFSTHAIGASNAGHIYQTEEHERTEERVAE